MMNRPIINVDKDTPIRPGVETDGWYSYCPICECFDLMPTNIITRCPKCNQAIEWSWMEEFRDR